MTIFDEMKAPTKPRNEDLERLIEHTGQRVSMAEIRELVRMAAHEYDEQAVEPAAGSAGEQFLRAVARTFVRWIDREGRFPAWDEHDAVAAEVVWHREEVTASVVAQAYVDLGLYFSHHADVTRGAGLDDFRRALDSAAGQLIFTLVAEYGPLD